jgi:hypothetical protein
MPKRWLLAGAVNLGAAVVAALAFGVWKRDTVDQGNDLTHMRIHPRAYDQGIEDVALIRAKTSTLAPGRWRLARPLDVLYVGPDHFRAVPEAHRAALRVALWRFLYLRRRRQ